MVGSNPPYKRSVGRHLSDQQVPVPPDRGAEDPGRVADSGQIHIDRWGVEDVLRLFTPRAFCVFKDLCEVALVNLEQCEIGRRGHQTQHRAGARKPIDGILFRKKKEMAAKSQETASPKPI
jgi:hypothetical protein